MSGHVPQSAGPGRDDAMWVSPSPENSRKPELMTPEGRAPTDSMK